MAAAVGAVLLGAMTQPARADLVERCAWPGPAGPSILPESTHVEVPPLVADLDGDGRPEIVVLSFVNGLDDNLGRDGVLRILSGADCSEIASVVDVGCVTCFGDSACRSLEGLGEAGIFCPACTPAIADLDGDGLMEIVLTTEPAAGSDRLRRLVVLDHRGRFLRCSEPTTEFTGPVAALAIADLDGDGQAEVLSRDVAWRASGELAWQNGLSGIGATMAADFDGDGRMEVTTGQVMYRADGTRLWASLVLGGGSPAVADFDLDCQPDLVVTSRNNETINLVDPMTGAIRASARIPAGDCPPRPDGQGGPPTLGDVDGDCVPEIGVAGCRRYALFKYAAGPPERLELLWEAPIDDATSRFTGSAIFDLEGDGIAEVLYNDHAALHVFDGPTGATRQAIPNSSATLLEYPVVADADNDGHADVLVAANGYSFACCDAGVRVFAGDVPLAPVRPLYNQHSYHVTNILDDGSIPAREEPSWSRQNTFRVQGAALRDDVFGPRLSGVPPDADVTCGGVPPPASPSASGGCGEAPAVGLDERVLPAGCAHDSDVVRTWTATDRCGRSTSETQVIRVRDRDAPALVGALADALAVCLAPPPPDVIAIDGCDPAPAVTFGELREDGPCPYAFRLVRTWTATDACGNASSREQIVVVEDDGPPELAGVPADALATCVAPPPPIVTATDGCDLAPLLAFTEAREDGPCPSIYRLVRTWTATDACGNAVAREQVVNVEDDGPPVLVGVPGDATVSCASVPPPAEVTAVDGCDPAPVVTLVERREDGSCQNEYRLIRTWTATDACGRTASASQVVQVVDDTPPVVVSAPSRACLWPPNHWMVCFGPEDFAPEIVDDCPGEISWRFAGCVSSQPENDLGDGDFAPDCVVEDGRICVRAERQGIDPAGRTYGLFIVATDACGNASSPALAGNIYVPHDQSPHEDCLKTTVVGRKGPGRP